MVVNDDDAQSVSFAAYRASARSERRESASGTGASTVMADSVSNETDILFHVRGLASVPDLATNTYLLGAVAAHLTSYGEQIPTSARQGRSRS